MDAINAQQMHRIKRQIERYGQECTITRKKLNDFGEPVGDSVVILSCKGLFHEATGRLSVKLDDPGHLQTEKQPMVLLLYNEALRLDDIVTINGTTYRITGFKDIGNIHAILDVSLGGDVDD